MLNHSINKDLGILLVRPNAPLSKEDFTGLNIDIGNYLSDHTRLHGIMVQTKGFPGWKNFEAFTAHMHFIREHYKQVLQTDRIAVVTDTPLAGMAEWLARHFTSNEVRHFPFTDEAEALEWLQRETPDKIGE